MKYLKHPLRISLPLLCIFLLTVMISISVVPARQPIAHADTAPIDISTWQGQGTYNNGGSTFNMLLNITGVNGNTFSGRLAEDTYSSAVAISGNITSSSTTDVNITFTDPSSLWGGRIALNTTYSATISNGNMKGFWFYAGKSSPDGTLLLSQKFTPTLTTDCAHLVTPWIALYQNSSFAGRQLCFEGTGLLNLSQFDFDKQTMSINIAANGTFFDQPNGQGNQLAFYSGDEQADLGNWDNRISSFRVDGGNNPPSTPTPTPKPTPKGRLVVFVQGVTTNLNFSGVPSGSFGLPNGIYEHLKAQYNNVTFLTFSYVGSDSLGNPKGYSCPDTFNRNISDYVALLRKQITAYMQHHPGTIVDIVGHSMGGAIAYGLLADMVVHGYIYTNGGYIDGIATLDSPLGGIPEGPGVTNEYLKRLVKNYQNTSGCQATKHWQIQDFKDLVNLTQIFGKAPYGTNDSLSRIVTKVGFSNLDIAKKAAHQTVPVHTITFENLRDYVYQPGDCHLPLPHLHFIDTQLINDQGFNSGIYGRPFVALAKGGDTCPNADGIVINHGAVFSDPAVAADVVQFVEGNTPSQLL